MTICAHSLLAQQVRISAEFDPAEIVAGSQGQYTISFENVRALPTLDPPSISGMQFGRNANSSTFQRIVNGVLSVQLSLSWACVAAQEGSYTVPARRVQIDGKTYTIPEARLRVVAPDERTQNLLKMRWVLPEGPFYVGQSIPATLQLLVASGVSISQLSGLEHNGDAFLIAGFSDNREDTREVVDGISYQALGFRTIISPIRAGEASLEASITVDYLDRATQQGRVSPFFNFGQRRTEQRRIGTGKHSVTVLEVPSQGRLPGFTGAVGEFSARASIDPVQVRAGEPLTLTIEVRGSGNFDRMQAPEIPENPDWRVYPATSEFAASDELNQRGVKTFEIIMVPAREGIESTPLVPFSAFNPRTGAFADLSVSPIEVLVTPAPAGGSSGTRFVQSVAPTASQTVEEQTFRSNRAELGSVRSGIRPIFMERSFQGIQLVLTVALVGGWFWQRRRLKLANDEGYARKIVGSRSVREWSKKANEAASAGRADDFYHAAQRALQESVGPYFPRGRRNESLTQSEVVERVRELGASESVRDAIHHLFATGDALKYAGSSMSDDQLSTDSDQLMTTLRELHKIGK